MGLLRHGKKYINDVHCFGLISNNYIWFNWIHKLNLLFFIRRSDDRGGDDDNNSNNITYYY
jgi:hypothetical protein